MADLSHKTRGSAFGRMTVDLRGRAERGHGPEGHVPVRPRPLCYNSRREKEEEVRRERQERQERQGPPEEAGPGRRDHRRPPRLPGPVRVHQRHQLRRQGPVVRHLADGRARDPQLRRQRSARISPRSSLSFLGLAAFVLPFVLGYAALRAVLRGTSAHLLKRLGTITLGLLIVCPAPGLRLRDTSRVPRQHVPGRRPPRRAPAQLPGPLPQHHRLVLLPPGRAGRCSCSSPPAGRWPRPSISPRGPSSPRPRRSASR